MKDSLPYQTDPDRLRLPTIFRIDYPGFTKDGCFKGGIMAILLRGLMYFWLLYTRLYIFSDLLSLLAQIFVAGFGGS